MKGWLFFLIGLLLIGQAFALGIAPSRDVMDYTSNEQVRQLTIINTNHKDMKLVLYAQGESPEAITLPQQTVSFTADESEKTIAYKVKLPNNFTPGKHEIDIVVLELPQTFIDSDQNTIVTDEQAIVFKNKETGGMIGASTALIQQLIINVPYPGMYAEGNLFITANDVDQPVTFTVGISNKGSQDLTITGRVKILGPTNEEVGVVSADPAHVTAGEETKLTMTWQAAVNPGVYAAEANVQYGEKYFIIRRTFVIGKNQVSIRDMNVEKFTLGQIAKLDVTVENEWNQKAENVYALVKILDSGGSMLTSFSTSTISMNPQSTAILNGYWETQGMSVGTYTIAVVLNFGGKQVERFFETVVGIDSLNIKDFSKIGGQVVVGESKQNSNTLLVIAIIVLIVVNIGWFVYLRRKKQ
ncbi:MAG: hypothetical protein V1725_01975 [archaeon]